ncbi:uncharacterized protein LOC110093107 [Dendrobium catenatum]|uniref:uncharacterized protein LOC110093107 n=1 Tax=Dendrobium catenatum TaxID=906689 RepID=UPI00109F0435|nr:uncharacterized protein LOC110093107 [Dendrobium catenatum]
MGSFSRRDIDRLIGRSWDFYYQPSVGRAGGILVMWKDSIGSFKTIFQSDQCVMGTLTMSNTVVWEIAMVYADNDRYVRRQLWEDISNHHNAEVPIVVGGGILIASWLLGGRRGVGRRRAVGYYSQAACDMGDFMAANDLVDPGFSGPAYTWSNNKDARSRIFCRLDRFLVSSALLDKFQGLKVTHLTRIASDHCPILCSVMEDGKRNYTHWIKFEDVWATFLKAWQIVSEKWKVHDMGSEAIKLQKKCKRSLRALFFWSRNKIRMLEQLRDDLDREIGILQMIECSPTGLSETQAETLRYKVQLLKATLARILMWWGQRAKVRWVEEGDGNTRFFHSMASARR